MRTRTCDDSQGCAAFAKADWVLLGQGTPVSVSYGRPIFIYFMSMVPNRSVHFRLTAPELGVRYCSKSNWHRYWKMWALYYFRNSAVSVMMTKITQFMWSESARLIAERLLTDSLQAFGVSNCWVLRLVMGQCRHLGRFRLSEFNR